MDGHRKKDLAQINDERISGIAGGGDVIELPEDAGWSGQMDGQNKKKGLTKIDDGQIDGIAGGGVIELPEDTGWRKQQSAQ